MLKMAVRMTADNGKIRATLLGSPMTYGEGQTPDQAMEALNAELVRVIQNREINWAVFNDEPQGLLALAGSLQDDPDIEDIVKEAYRRRDEQKQLEFPE